MAAPVYDYVPAGKKAPYVVLTDTTAESWSTKTVCGADVMATLKVYSEYQGDKEVAELCDRAISRQALCGTVALYNKLRAVKLLGCRIG